MFFLQAEDGIRYLVRSRGLGDVYKRQTQDSRFEMGKKQMIDRIKKDAGFKEDPAALAEYILSLIHI